MLERVDRGISRLSADWRASTRGWLILVVATLSFVAAAPAWSAEWEQVIQCTGASSGNLNSGDLTAASVGSGLADSDFPDWGAVSGYREAAQVPMTQTGAPTANREHAGLAVIKQRSKSSPLYMRALVTKEQLQCTIEFWERGSTDVKWFTVALTNARIESIEIVSSDHYDGLETIVFRAQQITWTHNPTGITYTDNLTASP